MKLTKAQQAEQTEQTEAKNVPSETRMSLKMSEVARMSKETVTLLYRIANRRR